MSINPNFWKGRRVLLSGHTGFKGAWLSLFLEKMEANVCGVSLSLPTNPSLYEILSPWSNLESILCDICDQTRLSKIVTQFSPEIVVHMAAQPLVRESYRDPVGTIETNVMGTVYLLESLRLVKNLKAILIVTSDKVYENYNHGMPLFESDPLGGTDPYSASKAATEIITHSYAKSFFLENGISVCTARAGNVIGGGDWAKDRLIPDLWRAYSNNQTVELRYPGAVRPWQHVFDSLYGYLLYIEHMVSVSKDIPKALNFGPPPKPTRTVLDLAKHFSKRLETKDLWTIGVPDLLLKENNFLSIDPSLACKTLGWKSVLTVDEAIAWTCEWYSAFKDGRKMRCFSNDQLVGYLDLACAKNISPYKLIPEAS